MHQEKMALRVQSHFITWRYSMAGLKSLPRPANTLEYLTNQPYALSTLLCLLTMPNSVASVLRCASAHCTVS